VSRPCGKCPDTEAQTQREVKIEDSFTSYAVSCGAPHDTAYGTASGDETSKARSYSASGITLVDARVRCVALTYTYDTSSSSSSFILPMSTIHEKKHNEYTIGKTYKAHRALTVALN